MSTLKGLRQAASIPRYQWRDQPILLNDESCRGKTYIITGANSGLGLEAAKHLVRFGAKKVICACRSASRGEAAVAAIESETGVHGVAELWLLDMASQHSCIDFAQRAKEELEFIDALVLNAAAANKDWILCEGWESGLAVNVLNTVLLTILMMPQLSECAAKTNVMPRVQIVTSGLAFDAQADLERANKDTILKDLNTEAMYPIRGVSRYNQSKLLQLFAIRHLASIAPSSRTGVVINIVSPGLAKTNLVQYSDGQTKIVVGVLRAIMGRSAEWGSRDLLHGIALGEESHGKYLQYCGIHEDWVPAWISNEDGRDWGERIWKEVSAECERAQPGCISKGLEAVRLGELST